MMSSPPITVETRRRHPRHRIEERFVKSSRGAPVIIGTRRTGGSAIQTPEAMRNGLLHGEPLSHPVRTSHRSSASPTRTVTMHRWDEGSGRCPSRNRDRPQSAPPSTRRGRCRAARSRIPCVEDRIMAPMLGGRKDASQPRNGWQARLAAGEMPCPRDENVPPRATGGDKRQPSPRESSSGETRVRGLSGR